MTIAQKIKDAKNTLKVFFFFLSMINILTTPNKRERERSAIKFPSGLLATKLERKVPPMDGNHSNGKGE